METLQANVSSTVNGGSILVADMNPPTGEAFYRFEAIHLLTKP